MPDDLSSLDEEFQQNLRAAYLTDAHLTDAHLNDAHLTDESLVVEIRPGVVTEPAPDLSYTPLPVARARTSWWRCLLARWRVWRSRADADTLIPGAVAPFWYRNKDS